MKFITIFLCAICGFFICACSTVNTIEPANPTAKYKIVKDKRIITDSSLNDYAYVIFINETKVGELLKIQARIVNDSSSRHTIKYKFDWIDKEGMEVSSANSPWSTLILEGGEVRNISAVAPYKSVSDFTLKMISQE